MAAMALSVAGAVIGSFFGAPEIGWMIGSLAGALLFPPKGKTPQINDIRIQQSAYGQPIPQVYGMFRVAGNIIWAGQPVEHDSGGKGGKGPGTPKVTMSFAVGLCKGPIQGVRRIWANGKIVYDLSDPTNFANLSGSANMLSNFNLYLGDEFQTADPVMQAALGAANVPAYRGLAYIVFNNIDLSTWGNFLPSFTFEVMTQAGNTSYSAVQSTWTPEPGGTFIWSMNDLSVNGGVALGHQYYIQYDGLWTGILTPYGSSYKFIWNGPGNNPGGSGMGVGSADQACTISPLGWWDEDGVEHTGPGFALIPWPTNFDEWTYCMLNGNLYITSDYGGGVYNVYRLDTLTNNLQATSALSGALQIVGATVSHVYMVASAASGTAATNTLYQLDRTTLATTNSWAFSGGFGGQAGPGYALDDDHIYSCDGGGYVWQFRPSQNAWTRLGKSPFFGGGLTMKAINPNLFVFSGPDSYSQSIHFGYMATAVTPNGGGGQTLSSIVADICGRAGLSSSQYDVSQLTDIVPGYAITAHNAPRDSITPLMQSYFFDVSDTDGLLKFVKRGSQPATTFLYADLGAGHTVKDPGAQNPIQETLVQELDLPRSLTLKYINQATDYQESTQRAFRTTTSSNLDMAAQIAIVMSDDDAIQKVQSMLWSAWVGRQQFEFSTSLKYLQNEPTDVVSLQNAVGQLYTARITSCQYDGNGILKWRALGEYPGLYSSTAAGGASSGFTPQQVGYSGPTILAVLDVPPLRPQDTGPGLYLAACGYASNWPGCAVYDSSDGNAYSSIASITHASTIGQVGSPPLGNFLGGNIPDELNVITVQVFEGSLSSVSYANFMAGANAAWVGGEIIFFRTATLVSANTYQVSGLLRGQGGTEKFMSGHLAGELFVFLDQTKMEVVNGLSPSLVGNTEYFQTYLLNQFYSQTPQTQSQVIANERIKPLSPVLFAAAHGSAGSVNDIVLQWVRRARVNYAWVDGADVALDESAETYTLGIYNGTTLVRSVSVAGPFTSPSLPNYTYTAANITADGFSSGNTISFKVQQNSDQGVLGDVASTTITR